MYDHKILQRKYRLAHDCMVDIAIVMRITYMVYDNIFIVHKLQSHTPPILLAHVRHESIV